VYGWTRNPLVEYYVIESYGTYNPSSGAQIKGSFQTDGGTYNVAVSTRYNQPSIDGTRTFQQYW
jgi:endo-1,4-beta-xylanase